MSQLSPFCSAHPAGVLTGCVECAMARRAAAAGNVTQLTRDIRGTSEPLNGAVGFEDLPPIMSPKTLAEILEVSTKTLERWRDARARDGKTGPAWHKLPGSSLIRYSRADVIEWFAACREAEAAS